MNKKGSLLDGIYIPLYILIISVTIFIASIVWSSFSTNFQTISDDTPQNGTITAALTDIQIGFDSFDYVFPFLVGGLLTSSKCVNMK